MRTTFPNPIRGAGCDYLRGCERARHYTGFLSAEESQERRMQLREASWEPLWKEDGGCIHLSPCLADDRGACVSSPITGARMHTFAMLDRRL